MSFIDYGLCVLIYMVLLLEGWMISIFEVIDVYGVFCNYMVKIIN